MIRSGLCSVTLRAHSVDEVARLAGECGLATIEWGGDVHVPPGDDVATRRARAAATAADVAVASYGSYLFAAGPPTAAESGAVLDTASALGAPNVRVWAGFGILAPSPEYSTLVAGLSSFAAEAAARHITVGLEFHGGTPTATVEGAVALLDAVGAANLSCYWQPPYWNGPTTPAADAAEVTALGARLAHLHVEGAGGENLRPLAHRRARWSAVLDAARALGGDRVAFLEFVAGDDPDAVRRDAGTLLDLLAAP